MEPAAPSGLDAVTLKDLYAAFADFASEEALDVAAFTACLQRMGIGIPALAERLFHAFDHAKSGRIDFRTFATGMSLVCNDASAADRLELTFSILTNNTAVGLISAAEVKSLVREFLWAAMDVVQGLMDTTSSLFQPGAGELGETADARRAVEAAAAAQVDRVAEAITQEALAAGGLSGRDLAEGQGLGREEFRRWASAQPRLLTWVAHLGQQWRVAIAEQATNVARAAASAAQAGSSDGEAAAAGAVDVDGVREVVFGLQDWPDHAQQTLDEVEFAACMRKLGMKNEALAEHLFQAFDANDNGFVDPGEFTVGLTRMCSKSKAEQLTLAHSLFDLDRDGSVSREEFGRFVASFSALGLAQVQRHVDLFHDIFGAAGGSHGSFGQAVWAAAHERVDAHTQRLVSHVFGHAGAASEMALDMSQFESWYDSTPAFSAWLGRTGATLATVVAQLRTPPEVAQVKQQANAELVAQMAQDAADLPDTQPAPPGPQLPPPPNTRSTGSADTPAMATQPPPPPQERKPAASSSENLPRAAALGGSLGGDAEVGAGVPSGGGDIEVRSSTSGARGGGITPRLRAMGHEREERDRERERRANERHQRLLRAQQSAGAPPAQSTAGMSALPSAGAGSMGGAPAQDQGDFRQFREQLYSSLSGAGLPLPQRPADAQDFRFLTEWLLRMREVQSHGQGELRMARNEIARLMDRVAALEKLVREKDNEIIELRDEAEELRVRGPAQAAPQPMQMQMQTAAVGAGPAAPMQIAGAPAAAGAGGVGLREMADELGRLEELLNEKNRATAELKATSAAADEVVLSVADYEALRDECKKRAHEVDNNQRQFEKELKARDECIEELQGKISDAEYQGEQAMAMKAESQSKDAEIAALQDRLEEKDEELAAERQKARDAEDREAAGMQAMGWNKEGGNKAAALVAAEKEQNKLLTARIESLTADREDKRRRHREELERVKAELDTLKTAASKSSSDKRSAQKEKEKALEKDASDLRMQVKKLQRDKDSLEKGKRLAETDVKKLTEQLEQRIAEVSSLKSTNEVRRRASQRATNEAAQKSQELARMQRRGGSTESAGTEARRRRSSRSGSREEAAPAEGAELFARLASADISISGAERQQLLSAVGAMPPAELADALHQADQDGDPLVGELGVTLGGASDEDLHAQVLSAIQRSERAADAALQLFPHDDEMSYDDEDDDFGVEDNWARQRQA